MNRSKYIQKIRSKIGHELLMIPSVAAVILNDQNELLLQEKHKENWSLPAGMIEPGESPKTAIIREVLEETGLEVKPDKLLGVFGGESFRYTYPSGDQVEYTVILMRCSALANTQIIADTETVSLRYFAQENIPELALPYPISALFDENEASVIS